MWAALKNRIAFVVTFLVGSVGLVVIWFRTCIAAKDIDEQKAAEKKVEEHKVAVEKARSEVQAALEESAAVREQVEAQAAKIDEKAAADKQRDSVDVANDIIRGV